MENNNETRIYCLNDHRYYDLPKGTTIREAYTHIGQTLPYPLVGAKVNEKIVGTGYEIYTPQDVTFLDLTSETGMSIYTRSLCFLLCSAAKEVFHGANVRFAFTISHNVFVTLHRVGDDAPVALDADGVGRLKARMQELVAQDLPFERSVEHATDVARMFRDLGDTAKADLIETSGLLYETYYRMNGYVDFYYSALLPSTGGLTLFDLRPYEDGMLLIVPDRHRPDRLQDVYPQPKLFRTLREDVLFNRKAGFQNVGSMNRIVEAGEVGPFIRVNEAMQEKRLAAIAERIAARPEVRMVLISGPSSSGKTSTSRRLSTQLSTCLKRPVALSLDNWFVNREDTPLDEYGEKDYESLHALDLPQFNRDLTDLLEGREVALPTYNFQTGLREYRGQRLRLQPDTLLVIEGIHALNPELTAAIPDTAKFRIYASALTSIALDDHNWISTHDNRLLRRIIRDYQYRGASAADTIRRWPSVHRGEERWIFPYQEQADVVFNTAMLYEIPAIRPKIENVLREVRHDVPEAAEAQRLLYFLQYFKPIYDTEIPNQSLLREFIGGSVLDL